MGLNGGFLNYFGTFGFSMDIQFWIWLIVIVITLIARANKKKPNPADDDGQEPLPENKPISFEDLLREIQATRQPKPAAPVTPPVAKSSTYEVEDYDDDLKDEAAPVEKSDYRTDDEIYETYERAKREAFAKPSLEETLKVEDIQVSFEQFKRYKKQGRSNAASEYVKELRNPSSFKKAFILSEVLKRRY